MARGVEKSQPVVLARVPALRFFGSRASALGHSETAGSLELEAGVGVADMEVDRGTDRSSGQNIEDNKVRDVPWGSLDEGVARAVFRVGGGKGVG